MAGGPRRGQPKGAPCVDSRNEQVAGYYALAYCQYAEGCPLYRSSESVVERGSSTTGEQGAQNYRKEHILEQ